MIEHALEYAAAGFSVVACQPRGKRAIGEWKRAQIERATQEHVRALWRKYPQANIGIVTGAVSGIVVVDTDNEQAEAWAREHLPPTRTSRTGMGYHRLYLHPGYTIPNAVGWQGIAGLDIRGDGGYIVAPPSLHPNGMRYAWEDERPIEPLPAALLGLGRKREQGYIAATVRGKLEDACARISAAADGTKHVVLRDNARIVGGYLHYGTLTRAQAAAALEGALPSSVRDWKQARETIEEALAHGEASPLTIDVPAAAPARARATAPDRGAPDGQADAPDDQADTPDGQADTPDDQADTTTTRPSRKKIRQRDDDQADDQGITIDGETMKLPPGYRYSGMLFRGDKIVYMGKIWLSETGTNIHTQENTAVVQWETGNERGHTVLLRSELASQAGVTRALGGAGAAIHAHNAKDISRYLVEFGTWNRRHIPHSQHSEYYGNVDGGMLLPAGELGTTTRYIGRPIWVGDNPTVYPETLRVVSEWATPMFWAILAMALSSLIYARLRVDRNPVVHLGGTSGSGKTTLVHFAVGAYGDPRVTPLQVQCGSGTTTPKGMSTALIQANGLPVFFDDLHKMLERKKQETEGIVYDFANGQNRTYGTPGNRATGGGQEVRGLLLTAGETSLNFMNAGSNNRVFSFDCGTAGQQPLGCPARSNEGMGRARQMQAAWQAGAGLFGKQVLEHVLSNWDSYQLDIRAFEFDRRLEPLQAWRRLLAVAAATLQVIANLVELEELDIDEMVREWARILQANNQARDPADDAFERVRLLFIQSEHTHDGGAGIATWHYLHYDRHLVAVRREGQKYWRALHTSNEWRAYVGENSVEMFAGAWLDKGLIFPHKSGKISDTTWVGKGSPRCLLIKDFLSPIAPEDESDEI